MAYWLQPEELSAQQGLQLIHNLRELSRCATRYKQLLWDTAERDVLQLKIKTTGTDFQQSERRVLSPGDPFVSDFCACATVLCLRIRNLLDDQEDLD